MINDLLSYENDLISQGIHIIAGMDEAGRGPLAGPVAVACCIMNLDDIIDGVNDSKKLSAKKRELLFDQIKEKAICYSVVFVDEKEIDKINILNATKMGMEKALLNMFPIPEMLLVDYVKHSFGVPYKAIVHGDALSYSIACASILAKVTRDRLMVEYAKKYPEYGFEKHKGYGTKLHIEMLQKYNICPIHRKSFVGHFVDL
ncbi:MAG: ribonuclease HII [Clostridia bacterium]